jgi:hypothetical protein
MLILEESGTQSHGGGPGELRARELGFYLLTPEGCCGGGKTGILGHLPVTQVNRF